MIKKVVQRSHGFKRSKSLQEPVSVQCSLLIHTLDICKTIARVFNFDIE